MAHIYHYRATLKGAPIEGYITGENQASAMQQLRLAHYVNPHCQVCDTLTDDFAHTYVTESPLRRTLRTVGISRLAIEQSFGQIGSLLKAGVQIVKAVQLAARLSPPNLRFAWGQVIVRISAGESLYKVMAQEMTFIDPVTLNLIHVGEENGSLDQMFTYSAELMKQRRAVKGDMMQAMFYPIFVILVASGVLWFMMHFVIPKIMKFLTARNVALPPITEAMVNTVHFLQDYGLYLAAAPFVLWGVMHTLCKNPIIAYHVDRIKLRIPMLGGMVEAANNAMWTNTLGMLMHSGIQIVQALDLCQSTVANRYFRKQFEWISDLVKQGQPLSIGVKVTALSKVCPLAESMIRIGENTGTIDENLFYVAGFYQEALKRRLTLLSRMIEPVMFLVLGGMIAFIYIGFFMGLMALSKRGG